MPKEKQGGREPNGKWQPLSKNIQGMGHWGSSGAQAGAVAYAEGQGTGHRAPVSHARTALAEQRCQAGKTQMQLATQSHEEEGHAATGPPEPELLARAQLTVGALSALAVGEEGTVPTREQVKPGAAWGGGQHPSCHLTVWDLNSDSQQESWEVSPETGGLCLAPSEGFPETPIRPSP